MTTYLDAMQLAAWLNIDDGGDDSVEGDDGDETDDVEEPIEEIADE